MLELNSFVQMMAPLVGGGMVVAAALVVLIAGPRGTRLPGRWLAVWPIVWLAAIAAVLAHAYVWNPLAKLPERTFDEIADVLLRGITQNDIVFAAVGVAATAALPVVVAMAGAGARLRHPLALGVLGLGGLAELLACAPYIGWGVTIGLSAGFDATAINATPFVPIAVAASAALGVVALLLALVVSVRAQLRPAPDAPRRAGARVLSPSGG